MKKAKVFIGLILSFGLLNILIAGELQAPENRYKIGEQEIIPVGWSKEGSFAYFLHYNTGELCGHCPVYDFVIQSLVSDQILFKKSFDALDETEESTLELGKVIESHRSLIKAKLAQYQIIPGKPLLTGLGSGEFQHKGSTYSVKLYPKSMIYEDEFMGNPVTQTVFSELRVILSKKRGVGPRLEKVVHRYTKSKDGYFHLIAAEYAGYFLSPYEDRAALILKKSHWGCCVEGTSQNESLIIIGAHLQTRFK